MKSVAASPIGTSYLWPFPLNGGMLSPFTQAMHPWSHSRICRLVCINKTLAAGLLRVSMRPRMLISSRAPRSPGLDLTARKFTTSLYATSPPQQLTTSIMGYFCNVICTSCLTKSLCPVVKARKVVSHYLKRTNEIGNLYHNAEIRMPGPPPPVQFLWSPIAWSILLHVGNFKDRLRLVGRIPVEEKNDGNIAAATKLIPETRKHDETTPPPQEAYTCRRWQEKGQRRPRLHLCLRN